MSASAIPTQSTNISGNRVRRPTICFQKEGTGMEEFVRYLRALVYLQSQAIRSEEGAVKTEVLLAKAGLPYKEIAEILGKSEMAVAKTVSRAKATNNKKGTNDE
jgi:hypothetical protein